MQRVMHTAMFAEGSRRDQTLKGVNISSHICVAGHVVCVKFTQGENSAHLLILAHKLLKLPAQVDKPLRREFILKKNKLPAISCFIANCFLKNLNIIVKNEWTIGVLFATNFYIPIVFT